MIAHSMLYPIFENDIDKHSKSNDIQGIYVVITGELGYEKRNIDLDVDYQRPIPWTAIGSWHTLPPSTSHFSECRVQLSMGRGQEGKVYHPAISDLQHDLLVNMARAEQNHLRTKMKYLFKNSIFNQPTNIDISLSNRSFQSSWLIGCLNFTWFRTYQ